MPKISILVPSYNHQKYVGAFIESALAQSFEDFELIIVDDASTDGNVEEILKYKDERIILIKHPYNRGINAGLNTAFKKSQSPVVIFIASDDLLEHHALEQIHLAHQNRELVVAYTKLTPIDENNQVIPQALYGYLDMKLLSREEFIWTTFLQRNVFVSPGMSVKRKFLSKIMPLPCAMMNYQDYLLHIELMKFGEITVLPERIVRYRLPLAISNNASSPNEATFWRECLETEALLDAFLSYDDIEFLERTFAREIASSGVRPYRETLPFFFGVMALFSPVQVRKFWGYHQIMKFYNSKNGQEILHEKYGFTFAHFLKLTKFFTGVQQ